VLLQLLHVLPGAAFIHDLLVVLTTKAELQQLMLPDEGTVKGLSRLLQDLDSQHGTSTRQVSKREQALLAIQQLACGVLQDLLGTATGLPSRQVVGNLPHCS
jgi:hypothetical protein